MKTVGILVFVRFACLSLLLTVSSWTVFTLKFVRKLDSTSNIPTATITPCWTDNESKWKVVVTSNIAFEKELLNWWYHFEKSGMLDHSVEVVLYAEDEHIYEIYKDSPKLTVKKAWGTQTRFKDVGLTESDKFVIGQAGFNELVSRRPSILLNELQVGGPQVLYMDLDVIMLQDPRPLFIGDYDFWAAKADNSAQKTSQHWVFNSGFLALRSTEATVELLTRWKAKLEEPKQAGTNQGPFNFVITQMEREKRLKVRLLLDRVFPVGKKYRDDARRQGVTDSGYGTTASSAIDASETPPVNQNAVSTQQALLPNTEGMMPGSTNNNSIRPLPADCVAFHNNFCSSYKDCKIDRARALGIWVDLERTALL